MAINLVSLISQFLTPQLVGSLARAAGVNEVIAQRRSLPLFRRSLARSAPRRPHRRGAEVAMAVPNSDPDLLGKFAGAINGGNVGALTEGASALSALIGGSLDFPDRGATLSQFAGVRFLVGCLSRPIGAVNRSDSRTISARPTPSNWSDASSIAGLLEARAAIAAPLFRPTSPRRWEPRDCSLVSAAPLAESARRRAASAPAAGRTRRFRRSEQHPQPPLRAAEKRQRRGEPRASHGDQRGRLCRRGA